MTEIFDVAIIGSGPAGLTAAIYTARANLKTLVLAGEKWGGQLMLTTAVENFPGFPDGILGPELMEKMKQQAEKFGTKIIFSDVSQLAKPASPAKRGELDQLDQFAITAKEKYFAKSVIVATGAETKWLGLANEQRLIGRGVSSCAPCDGFFFKGKKVAVVGGGDAAMEEALVLTKFASEVTIIHRREAFKASKIMQDRVKNNPKIKTLFNTEIIDVLGQDRVEGVAFKNGNSLKVDGLFVAIGHRPNDELLKNLEGVEGVFIAGDVIDLKYKQAVTAAGFGCQAALDCEKWLETGH
ncbi:FAD-dependent oxidoreductase [Candidatus Gottesmanbacteria bacterium]|nr:FAD-dependent oxidoreductase [Candidatus Gottesmanbacteria bacterium]